MTTDTFTALSDRRPLMDAQGIQAVVRRHLQPRLNEAGLTQDDVGDRDSLTQTGLLDSFALMELLARLEQEFGVELDFAALEVQEFTTLSGLGRAFASAMKR